jgi:hypothetical protein
MGIADIMRGSSVASETLGAQEIKNKWGTLRLKRGQKAVAEFVRGCLRLAAELSFTRLAPETIRQMTGSTLPPQAQLDQFELQAQAPGAQLPPEAQALMALPSFEEALTLCQNDILRRYTIDIETNSTVEPEAVEDQKNISELMTALGQFLNGVGPLVEKGVMPFEVAQTMMLSITRRFRFGSEIEDQVKAMKPPPPQRQRAG